MYVRHNQADLRYLQAKLYWSTLNCQLLTCSELQSDEEEAEDGESDGEEPDDGCVLESDDDGGGDN